jgi:thioredoxin:protein disulfide reductase
MKQLLRLCLLILVCVIPPVALAGLPDMSGIQAEEEFLPVAQAFRASSQQEGDRWRVHFEIASGYYLYRDRILLNAEDVRVQFVQASESKLDKNFGRVEIFHNQLDLIIEGNIHQPLSLSYQGCSERQLCYPPQTLPLGTNTTPAASTTVSASESGSDDLFSGHGVWWVILTFAGLGLGLAFTPCVFPMIPILSSIIAGQNRQNLTAGRGFALALSYVVGMASSYALIGALVSAFGASFNMTALTQMPVVIIGAALLFVVLSLAMFGVYELQLPSALRQRLDGLSNRQQGGQLFSTWMMGFFASLVVSPCVSAPLAGALVYLSTTGDILTGSAALFAMGMGMGVPLLLIGMSGGKLLPRAGGWMLVIKNAFGVALLGVSLALLSRLLPAPVTMGLAGMLAIGIAVFLGLLERPDSARKRFSASLGLISLMVGVLWLVGAAQGNHDWLTPVSGSHQAPDNQSGRVISSAGPRAVFDDVNALMNSISIDTDPRPVVLDIYADWCASCAEMDDLLDTGASRRALSSFRLLRLDITRSTAEQRELLANLKIFGPPALQLYSHNALPMGTALQGLPEQAELLQWLGSGRSQ